MPVRRMVFYYLLPQHGGLDRMPGNSISAAQSQVIRISQAVRVTVDFE